MNLRKTIRTILTENLDSFQQEFRDFVTSVNFSSKGYNLQSITHETFQDNSNSIMLDFFTLTLQHAKPDFKRFVQQRANQPGRTGRIYGDTPTSKTMLTRWLTGYKDGADIDARQKSAAIKIAQLTGLDAIQELVIDPFEAQHPGVTVVANFTGAKTKNKGLSFFEVYVLPPLAGAEPEVPEPPTEIPVDDEVVEIPPESVTPPVAKPPKTPKTPKKPRKRRGKKKPKLTAKQKKAGYNQINAQGDIRHVLSQSELQNIDDHIVEIMFGSKNDKIEELGPQDAYDAYNRLRARDEMGDDKVFRVLDDYYDNPLPVLKFYGVNIYMGKIRSRALMAAYTSMGSNQKEAMVADEEGEWVKGMADNPLFGVDDEDEYTPPKLGGKEAKDVRRYANLTKSNDELIIYAVVERRENRYTGRLSKHTGSVILYVFQLDRNFPEEA